MPAQGEDAAAWTADISQQELEDRGGADGLYACGVLRPAHCVTNHSGAVPAAGAHKRSGHFENRLSGRAADTLDHLGRVPRVVALEDLEHTARVPQRQVGYAWMREIRRA